MEKSSFCEHEACINTGTKSEIFNELAVELIHMLLSAVVPDHLNLQVK